MQTKYKAIFQYNYEVTVVAEDEDQAMDRAYGEMEKKEAHEAIEKRLLVIEPHEEEPDPEAVLSFPGDV